MVPREMALRDEVVRLNSALIVPPAPDAPNSASQKSGVFDSAGAFVEAAVTFRPGSQLNSAPPYPDEATIEDLKGSFMFGGVLFGHFGHFLMDTLARIWAIEELRPRIEGVLFTPKVNNSRFGHVLEVQQPLMRALGLDLPILIVEKPTRVETLFVPYQGIGLSDGWELGTERFRSYMQRFGGKGIAPNGPERIYISRTGLGTGRASFLLEKTLEENLAQSGYTVVHPQRLSKEEQIATYRAAKYIISPDGSPLHLLAYVGGPDQRVAVIPRRSAEAGEMFDAHLSVFTGCFAVTLDCLRNDWLPQGHGRPGRLTWGEVDLERAFDLLQDHGFLPAGGPRWVAPDASVLAEELKRVEEHVGSPLRPFRNPESGRAAAP